MTEWSEILAMRLLEDKNIPANIIINIYNMYKGKNYTIDEAIVKHPKTPDYIIKEIYYSYLNEYKNKEGDSFDLYLKLESIERKITLNPNASEDILTEIYYNNKNKTDTKIIEYIASNPKTPVYIIEELFKSGDSDILDSLAENPKAPVYILEELFKSNEYCILYRLAGNPNIPINILIEIYKKADHAIKIKIAGNPRTPVDIIYKLYKIGDVDIIDKIAINSSTPLDLLIEIYNKAKMYDKYDRNSIYISLMKNPKLPENIIREIYKSDPDYLEEYVAQAPNTPNDLLDELAKVYSWYTKINVVRHPNTRLDTLLYLLYYDDDELVKDLALVKLNIKCGRFV